MDFNSARPEPDAESMAKLRTTMKAALTILNEIAVNITKSSGVEELASATLVPYKAYWTFIVQDCQCSHSCRFMYQCPGEEFASPPPATECSLRSIPHTPSLILYRNKETTEVKEDRRPMLTPVNINRVH